MRLSESHRLPVALDDAWGAGGLVARMSEPSIEPAAQRMAAQFFARLGAAAAA